MTVKDNIVKRAFDEFTFMHLTEVLDNYQAHVNYFI